MDSCIFAPPRRHQSSLRVMTAVVLGSSIAAGEVQLFGASAVEKRWYMALILEVVKKPCRFFKAGRAVGEATNI